MVRYEIKKVFSRTSSKVALGLLLALLLFVCNSAIRAESYTNAEGETEQGIAAVRAMMEEKREWAGPLDEAAIVKVIQRNKELSIGPNPSQEEIEESNRRFHEKIGFMSIRQMLIYSFCDFNGYDYYVPDKLSPEDAKDFYTNRVEHLKEWMALEENEGLLSQKEQQFLIGQYEAMEQPIWYEPVDGWSNMFELMPMLTMITMLTLAFLVAGIFSSEFQWKANDVFYSSYYGRNRAISAKIKAGLLIVTVIYWVQVLLYSAIVLGIYGMDGKDCVIQISFWKSFYNMTYGELYLLLILGGYVGTLFFMLLCMVVSAKTKSAVIAVIVPFALLFLPELLKGAVNSNGINRIINMMPGFLMQINMEVRYFNLFEIGGKIVGAVEVLLPVYLFLCVLLCPALYFIFAGNGQSRHAWAIWRRLRGSKTP